MQDTWPLRYLTYVSACSAACARAATVCYSYVRTRAVLSESSYVSLPCRRLVSGGRLFPGPDAVQAAAGRRRLGRPPRDSFVSSFMLCRCGGLNSRSGGGRTHATRSVPRESRKINLFSSFLTKDACLVGIE
jgi:hypothetical protein